MVQRSKDRNSKGQFNPLAMPLKRMCILSVFVTLVAVTTVDLLVLFLILLPGLLDVRLVALGESILVIVASVLDVFAVGARDGVAVA